MMWYLLDENKEPYPVSLEESYQLFHDLDMKIVQQDKLDNGMFVSTVFLGLDHDWSDDPDHVPVLFETMVFCSDDVDQIYEYQERYTSYADALAGHQRALDYANKIN